MDNINRPLAVWRGATPTKCDMNGETIKDEFVDGALRNGVWGILCPYCHKNYGVGLGIGRGQRYKLREDGRFVKVG